MRQKRWLKMLWLGALCGTVWALDGWSEETNPYWSIVERNPFNLKDPPPRPEPTPPPEPPKPPPPKVKLTGLTNLLGKKRALVEVTDTAGGNKVTPLIMVEGDSKEGVELVSISMEDNKVVMKIDGETSTIGFESPDTTQAAAANAAPGGKGAGVKPGTRVTPNSPRAIANASAAFNPNAAAATGGAPVVISSRGNSSGQNGGVTVAGATTSYAPAAGASYGTGSNPAPGPTYNATATAAARQYNSNTRAVPTRNMRTDPVPQVTAPKISQQELRELMIKRKAVNPSIPYPMPPQDQDAVLQILNEKK